MSSTESESLHPLSHRPQHICDGVVTASSSRRWTIPLIQRHCPSSLGRLDKLPLEVLHECIVSLDLRSLSRLARASLRGSKVVESLLPLRNLTQASGELLSVLAQARILRLHSLATLCKALHSDRCISCGGYGPFLLLLSAERCCFICLVGNQSLWMISLPQAKDCFNFKKHHMKHLPVMWSIPGQYKVPRLKSRRQTIRLTSVRAAKELAIKANGSFEKFITKFPLDPLDLPGPRASAWPWYREAPLHPLTQDLLTVNDRGIRPDDPCGGMGAFHFPSLFDGNLEYGNWCRACESVYDQFVIEELDPSTVARIVPQGCNIDVFLSRIRYRAWSKAEFDQHVKYCHSSDASSYRMLKATAVEDEAQTMVRQNLGLDFR